MPYPVAAVRQKSNVLPLLPFTFNPAIYPDGALPGPWVGSTAVITGGKVVITPSVTGPEQVANGDFSAWTGDNPDLWAMGFIEDAGSFVTQAAPGATFISDTAGKIIISQNALTLNAWNRVTVTVSAVPSGYLITNDATGQRFNGLISTPGVNVAENVPAHPNFRLQGWAVPLNETVVLISSKTISLPSMIALLPPTVADVRISGAWNIVAQHAAGVILNANHQTNPTHYVLGVFWFDAIGTVQVRIYKCVGGTYTRVLSANSAYVAGAGVEIRKSGTTYKIYYNNAQVGADQTILDVEIINNTYHGIFSTNGVNTLDSFFAQAT